MLRDGVPAGERNRRLTRLAGYLLRHYIDIEVTAELLHVVNTVRCKPPLPGTEVDTIIESVAGLELRRRRRVAA
jgi:hypothetical protein